MLLSSEAFGRPSPDLLYTSETFRRIATLPPGLERRLLGAACHALDSEGSFARAQLCSSVGVALGLELSRAQRLGTSIELFHLASLLLDDLPCMDDADARRSRPCSHVLYGEAQTILAALGFINQAYALLWQELSAVEEEARLEAGRIVEECLGFAGILDGQARDISGSGSRMDGDEVAQVARLKTGSLLRLCLLLPAVLADSGRYEKMHLTRLADRWGIAYQVADDLADLYLGESITGKTPQRDELLGRPNMALTLGEEKTAYILKSLLEEADGCIAAIASDETHRFEALRSFQERLAAKAKPLIAAYAAA